MRCYTQLAYLFHQCATSLLSRESRIADCTVRHPGVERLVSSILNAISSIITGGYGCVYHLFAYVLQPYNVSPKYFATIRGEV